MISAMKTVSCLSLAAALIATAAANEALDILEKNKAVEGVATPPLADGEAVAEELAEDAPPPVWKEKTWSPSPLDAVWSRAVLYENPDDPWLQQLAIMGLFDFRGSWGEVDVEGGNPVDLDMARTRRARLGARMKIFGNTEIEAVGEMAGSADFQRIERLKARTQLPADTAVEYGKFRPRFGIEGSKDPSQLLTPERSLLTSMLMPTETLGVWVNHQRKQWNYGLGWFSGDNDRFIPGFDGNGFLTANLAYDGVERTEDGGVMRSRWTLDYIFNLENGPSRALPRYQAGGLTAVNGPQGPIVNPAFRHLFATGIELEGERFGFEGEFILSNGDLNAWGMTLTPSYWAIPERLNIVARYHYADTDQAAGLVGGLGVGSDPLFDASPLFVGDEFHSFYLGANLHLYQDKMILMNGVEYARMKDESGAGFHSDGWIWHSGARISF